MARDSFAKVQVMQSDETNEEDIFQSEKMNKEATRETIVGLRDARNLTISVETTGHTSKTYRSSKIQVMQQ